jgi:hypothetical protein
VSATLPLAGPKKDVRHRAGGRNRGLKRRVFCLVLFLKKMAQITLSNNFLFCFNFHDYQILTKKVYDIIFNAGNRLPMAVCGSILDYHGVV